MLFPLRAAVCDTPRLTHVAQPGLSTDKRGCGAAIRIKSSGQIDFCGCGGERVTARRSPIILSVSAHVKYLAAPRTTWLNSNT